MNFLKVPFLSSICQICGLVGPWDPSPSVDRVSLCNVGIKGVCHHAAPLIPLCCLSCSVCAGSSQMPAQTITFLYTNYSSTCLLLDAL
ncbi:hypothetical protein I79_007960 [Cricetulus griseus]|uniref:Uncharacterized protein n=1 Tax=Cricetulus griseus TaxID=10029 RepID=G3HBQ3_CRIGR|nr:hypothetical protein I79_007960 [Cricetulus griseus]